MGQERRASRRSTSSWIWLAPAVALGLYNGRLLSERWPAQPGGAVVTTAMAVLLSVLLLYALRLGGRSLARSWPLLWLLVYVFSPEPRPVTAAAAAGLALLSYLLLAWPAGNRLARNRLWLPILLFIGFFGLYLFTLAPDLLPADNGEFQLVAANLGVAHPPGFPLYTLLAHLMTRLPVGPTDAYRVNLLSAVTSSLTVVLVYLSATAIGRGRLAGLIAALALGTATTFWAQATTANIRSLTALLAALTFYALIRFRSARPDGPTGRADGFLFLAVAGLSLGLTHHVSLIFMAPVFVVYVIWLDRALVRQPGRWLRLLPAVAIGLLPWLYLLWRGRAGAWGAPADLATLGGFVNHVLALGFRGDFFYFTSLDTLLPRLRIMGDVLAFQFAGLLLAGMVAGLGPLIKERRRLAWLLGGSFALYTLVTAIYRAPQTVEYLMPAYVPAAIGLGYAAGWLRRVRGRLTDRLAANAVLALLLLAAAGQAAANLPSYALLHQDKSARAYGEALLDQAPAGAVILADWHWAAPIWYLQEIEGQRPDVTTEYVFPTAEPYAETWARRIGELVGRGRPVIATHFDEATFADLPVPEPLAEAFLFNPSARQELPPNYTKVDSVIGGGIRLAGYHLAPATVEIGQESVLTLAWEQTASESESLTLFSHLEGVDGRLYAQDDRPAACQDEGGLCLTQFRLTPRLGAPPGEHALLVGAYGAETLLDDQGRPRTPVASLSVAPMSQRPPTGHPVYRTVPSGRPLLRLVGYDWDHSLAERPRLYLHWQTESGFQTEVIDSAIDGQWSIPNWFGPWGLLVERPIRVNDERERYVPLGQGLVWTGRPLSVEPGRAEPAWRLSLVQQFASGRPVLRDLIVSVRLIGFEEDGVHWAWWDLSDGVPAMGAIPTLKWIGGSRVRDPHWLTIPAEARPGQTVGPVVRLYDAFTNRPLPILDERLNQVGPWIPLGTTTLAE
jgi:4-amino-4-deoxy-L-arabinose transferase-like glycosyltransferase